MEYSSLLILSDYYNIQYLNMDSLLHEKEQQLIYELIPDLEQQLKEELIVRLQPLYQEQFEQKLRTLAAESNQKDSVVADAKQMIATNLSTISNQTLSVDKEIDKLLNRCKEAQKEKIMSNYIVQKRKTDLIASRHAHLLQEQVSNEARGSLDQWLEKERARQFKQVFVSYKKRLEREQEEIIHTHQERVLKLQHLKQSGNDYSNEFARYKAQVNIQIKKNQEQTRQIKQSLQCIQNQFSVQCHRIDKEAARLKKRISTEDETKQLIQFFGNELMDQSSMRQPQKKQSSDVYEVTANQLKTDMRVILDLSQVRKKIKQRLEEQGREQKECLRENKKREGFKERYELALRCIESRG